jgi:hypothetical protein
MKVQIRACLSVAAVEGTATNVIEHKKSFFLFKKGAGTHPLKTGKVEENNAPQMRHRQCRYVYRCVPA